MEVWNDNVLEQRETLVICNRNATKPDDSRMEQQRQDGNINYLSMSPKDRQLLFEEYIKKKYLENKESVLKVETSGTKDLKIMLLLEEIRTSEKVLSKISKRTGRKRIVD